MNIRQLNIFITVCKHLNFTKAAKELYMSQPAISHAINDLETALNCQLLERINHKIYINEAGHKFLIKAMQVVELYDNLENTFVLENQKQTITIGSSITIATFILPSLIQRYSLLNPDTIIKVIVDSAKNIEDKIVNNEVDLACIEGIPTSNHLVKRAFSSFDIIALSSPTHPFASKKKITINDLQETDILLREKGSAIRSCLDSALLLQNISIEPLWTSVNSQVLIEATKATLGITFLPSILVISQLEKKTLKKLEIENLSLINHNHLVYHKDKLLHPSLSSFIDFIFQTTK